jgi:hypothetical protein
MVRDASLYSSWSERTADIDIESWTNVKSSELTNVYRTINRGRKEQDVCSRNSFHIRPGHTLRLNVSLHLWGDTDLTLLREFVVKEMKAEERLCSVHLP